MSGKSGRGRNSNRDSARANGGRDASRLIEVENGLAATSPVPADIGAELPELTVDDAEIHNVVKLRNLWLNVKQREAGWLRAKERAEREEKSLLAEREQLEEARQAQTDRAGKMEEREADLARGEAELELQRSESRAGFAADRRAITQSASLRRDEILAEVALLEDEARASAGKFMSAAKRELDEERIRLRDEWTELRAAQTELQERELRVESQISFSQMKESMLTEQFARRLEAEVADIREQLDDITHLLSLERQRRERREQEVRDLRAEIAQYGDDPDEMNRRGDELSQTVKKLRDELSRRPLSTDVEELRRRAQAADSAEMEAAHWRQQHDAVDRQLRYQLVNVGELEVLRDERDTLTAQRETLRQALAQQRSDWEELQAKEGSAKPFPACAAYDNDAELVRPANTRELDSLRDLADEVRQRMATGSTEFYYSQSDVRLFLAGLAASRLHLLQGISGTGKTSLPREFFRALSGDDAAQIIEVQSGWRDKDDLFGYFNAFEKRFVESEFTKALYRALLPANVDRPMVIVLDEMNLAHPEQYFGSMLSILENAVTERGYIHLLTSEVPGLPARFEGARLPLPPNVWFVGTANHDETTVAFADKTYDRAHIQELPSRHEPFKGSWHGGADSISFRGLQAAFTAAANEHRRDVENVKQFFNKQLHLLFESFGIGWGNRLERQLDQFVPVVLACGGTVTEAADHLVATKLVRKLEDRFGVGPEDLDRLADNLEEQWAFGSEIPIKSSARIRAEASRLRGGYGS